MTTSQTILLFAPRLRDGTDYEAVLAARGWNVVRASTPHNFAAMLRARPVDLVVLDDPAVDLVKVAVAAMDAMEDPVPRIWISSLTEAPGESARIGVDALLLVPVDRVRLGDHAAALLEPRAQSTSGSHPVVFPLGSQLDARIPAGATPPPSPPDTVVGLRPRARRLRTDGGWDEEESTGNWP